MVQLKTLLLDTSKETLANDEQVLSDTSLGIEFLGWAPFQAFEDGVAEYGAKHIRWPGGIPAEDPLRLDTPEKLGDFGITGFSDFRNAEYGFDLANPNFVSDNENWLRGNGSEREGLTEMLAFVEENNIQSVSIVAPTARYVSEMVRIKTNGEIGFRSDELRTSVLQRASDDMKAFLENLYHSEENTPPEKLIIEVGSEYYATQLWYYFVKPEFLGAENPFTGNTDNAADLLLNGFGTVFAALVSAIADFEEEYGVDIETAVQAGKYTDQTSVTQNANSIFINSFNDPLVKNLDLDNDINPIEAVDGLIWHRYTTGFDSLSDEISVDSSTDPNDFPDLPAAIEAWEKASGNPDIDLVGGWLSPTGRSDTVDSRLQLSQLLQLFSELTAAGMDTSTAYATHHGNGGGLGKGSDLWLSGQLYALMIKNLAGTKIHEDFKWNKPLVEAVDHDNDPQTAVTLAVPTTESDHINEYVFSNEYKTVVYLAVGNIDDQGFRLTFELDKEAAFVRETHLYATSEEAEYVQKSYDEWKTWKRNGSLGSEPEHEIGVTGEQLVIEHYGGMISEITSEFKHDYELIEYITVVDTVSSNVSYNLRSVESDYQEIVQNLTLTGTKDRNGTGNQFDNYIKGNSGDNKLLGAGGNDTLVGGRGHDSLQGHIGSDLLIGGKGDDVYFVDHRDDKVHEVLNEGNDLVKSKVSFSLRANSQHIENLTLTGHDDVNGTGNSLANVIKGNSGDNELNGAWGNDTLVGGKGDDVFRDSQGIDLQVGGEGDDVYYVDHRSDEVVELAGEGDDLVNSKVSFSLRAHGQNLEDLTLTGQQNINGTGNSQANVITGNAGSNKLNGASGNDTLIGGKGDDIFRDGSGADLLIGGEGDDTFFIDSRRDQVVELIGEGNDLVNSKISFSLRAHSQDLEDLTLTGLNNINGTGNSQANVITGNAGSNRINGAAGNDTIEGQDGADVLIGGRGDDTLHGGKDKDTFVFKDDFGRDVISDFDPIADSDVIDLSGLSTIDNFRDLKDNHLNRVDGDLIIDDLNGNTITLTGVNISELQATDFLF